MKRGRVREKLVLVYENLESKKGKLFFSQDSKAAARAGATYMHSSRNSNLARGNFKEQN